MFINRRGRWGRLNNLNKKLTSRREGRKKYKN
jgi:hypothetical protein